MRRQAHLIALTFLLAGLGAVPAYADGAPPLPLPPGVTVPASPGSMPTGPTYVVTPGVGGSELPAPTDPKVAAEHAAAAGRTKAPRKHAGNTAEHPGAAIDRVAPTAAKQQSSSEDLAWEIGAGALLLLVVSEGFRIGFRRRALRPVA